MRIRFRLSSRARMSSVSSTSCFTAVPIVDSDDAMKSARRPGFGDIGRQRLQIVGQQRRQRHDLLEIRLDIAGERVDLETVGVVGVFGGLLHAGSQIRLSRDDLFERQTRKSLDDQAQTPVRQLEHLVDVRRGPDGVEIVPPRLFD